MTRRKLMAQRRRGECARFFEILGRGESTSAQRAALPRMRMLASRSGFTARAEQSGHRRCHRRRSRAMTTFRARMAFYLAFAPADCSYDRIRSAFLARPIFDDLNRSAAGPWEVLDERTGIVSLAPPRFIVPDGYVEWRAGGIQWVIPVTREQRDVVIAILRARRLQRPRPFVAIRPVSAVSAASEMAPPRPPEAPSADQNYVLWVDTAR